MLELFKNPPAEYRVTPFWFWNAKLHPDEIERQVREMHAKGAGGFFIHGRFGLRTEYMGEDWMRCIERACDVAQSLGMHVYLYDENPFPSGVAGGEAMKNEQHFNKFLDIARHTATSGETVNLTIPEGELLSAVAVRTDGTLDQIDLMPFVQDGELAWTASDGPCEVLVFVAAVARYPGFIYGSEPDYFEESLLDTFFHFTHNRYAERLKPYFGEVIKGIFTDEPKIQCIHHMHDDANTTAWFADLPRQFVADHGYDLLPRLACLVADAGPDTGKVRRDFWTTVTNQYVGRFFERYRKWCEDNGILLTGHLFLEEGLYSNTMYQGNFPQVLSEFHIPGVDHLALVAEGDYVIRTIPPSITRTHGQKLGSSVAHTRGRHRLLSETYGCAGWTLSMEHMKWIFDWQASMGINFLCPHAFYYSLAGVRKTDAPPSQFYQATYWPHYRHFADYVARVCYAMSQGTHRAQIGLLYPIKGFHSEWAPGVQGPVDKLIADYFDTYCSYLLKEHLDYDILDEPAIKRSLVLDQQLRIADEHYDLLIVPPTTAIGYDTALKIREFVQDGGKVIATMLLPIEDADADRHEDVRMLFEEAFGTDPVALRNRAMSGGVPDRTRFESGDGCAFFYEGPDPSHLVNSLRSMVSETIKPEVSVRHSGAECQDITVLHRKLEDGELFFFTNNCSEPRDVQISVRCDSAPHMLDLETGATSALPNCTQKGSRTILLHRFERYGSLLMYFNNEPALAVLPPAAEEAREIELSDEWKFELLGPNSLTLSEWNVNTSTGQDYMRYEYRHSFKAATVPDDLLLVLDDMPQVGSDAGCAGSNCTIYVNGAEARHTCPWVLDIGFQALDISALARVGDNEIIIVIEHGGWSGDPQLMLAECRLMGRFALDEGRQVILAPHSTIHSGSWTDQGYPYYSGTAAYRQTVRIPEFMRDQRVVLRAEDPADMVEFVVNGASAGVRPWAPFELDITPLVKPGENTIEIKVSNSLANMLLSSPRPSGLLGGARITLY